MTLRAPTSTGGRGYQRPHWRAERSVELDEPSTRFEWNRAPRRKYFQPNSGSLTFNHANLSKRDFQTPLLLRQGKANTDSPDR